MTKITCSKQYGFSLIETLIAVAILMIAITGPLSLVQAGLFSSNHQRNQVTATHLAQEALEYIKNIRDTNSYTQYTSTPRNWLANPTNTTFLLDVCDPDPPVGGCYVDPHGTLTGGLNIETVSSIVKYLTRTTTDGVFSYSYAGSDVTTFKRVVKIEPVDGGITDSLTGEPDEVTVTVTVDWMDNQITRTLTVSEILYNYQQAEAVVAINP